MKEIQHLNSGFLYTHEGEGIPLIRIKTKLFEALVSLQGAQLLSFKRDGEDFLWLSPKAVFEKGKSIRGGIPICAPWFGVHPDSRLPKHGFVRAGLWRLVDESIEENEASLTFEYVHKADDMYPYPFKLLYKMHFSSKIELSLNVHNTGVEPMPFSFAFHNYHPVSDLGSVEVTGLEGMSYLDAVDGFKSRRQEGAVTFQGEVDRVYEAGPEKLCIDGSNILIKQRNCPTTIVWNPGANLSEKLTDIGPEGYRGFVCVERGAAFGDECLVYAGEMREFQLEILKY